LADLNEVAVRVSQIAPDLRATILGRSEEDSSGVEPAPIAGMNVSDTDVHEGGGPGGISGWCQMNFRFVFGRSSTHVDDDLRVGESDHSRPLHGIDFSHEHNLTPEDLGVERNGRWDVPHD
jgi:hypothetical protein